MTRGISSDGEMQPSIGDIYISKMDKGRRGRSSPSRTKNRVKETLNEKERGKSARLEIRVAKPFNVTEKR